LISPSADGDGDLTQELNDPKVGKCLTKLRNLKWLY
jgi:hypothetical protein